jgi:hypothetical protein
MCVYVCDFVCVCECVSGWDCVKLAEDKEKVVITTLLCADGHPPSYNNIPTVGYLYHRATQKILSVGSILITKLQGPREARIAVN